MGSCDLFLFYISSRLKPDSLLFLHFLLLLIHREHLLILYVLTRGKPYVFGRSIYRLVYELTLTCCTKHFIFDIFEKTLLNLIILHVVVAIIVLCFDANKFPRVLFLRFLAQFSQFDRVSMEFAPLSKLFLAHRSYQSGAPVDKDKLICCHWLH